MRVTLFGYARLNPYLLLYKRALEGQGLVVDLERLLSLKWLATNGRSCDVVHIHWVETAYEPSFRSRLGRRLSRYRLVRSARSLLRFASFMSTLLLVKLSGKRIVYTVHNLAPHNSRQPRLLAALHRAAQRAVLNTASRVHVHSHSARRLLEAGYGRAASVSVVPHGNYIGYYPDSISRSDARRQLDLPNEAFVYLFLGLLRPYKGLEDLIDAFEKLSLPSSRLLLVGRMMDAAYKARIASLNHDNPTIRLISEYVPEEAIQVYMRASDVCVFPYKDATTSGAAMLALSFGRPVVAPAIGSFPELITPAVGILYDPARPDALRCALDQAWQQTRSEAAILDYTHQFDWDRLAPQLAKLYAPGSHWRVA